MTRNQELMSDSNYNGCGCLLLLMCILAVGAIAYPLLLTASIPSRSEEVKKREVKLYVGSMNRAQQAHFAEKSAFATSVDALGLNIKTETTNFKYSVSTTKQAAFNYGVSKNEKYKSYVGGVFLIRVKQNNAQDEIRTESIFCVADEPAAFIKPIPPQIQNSRLVCGTGTTKVTK